MNSQTTQTILTHEVLTQVNNERAFFETFGQKYPADPTVTVTETSIAGVKSYWFKPAVAKENNIIIFLHGGGYTIGGIKSHKPMVSHFTAALRTNVLFVEYSLAPEYPFPTANNEILAVYKELLQRYPGHHFSFIGDSAGGGLAVAATHAIAAEKLQSPAAVVLISPWLNLKANNASYQTRQALDPIFTREIIAGYARLYAAGAVSLADPDELEFGQFPPVSILAGTNEILFDDAKNFYEKIKEVQPKAQFKEYKNQLHVWPLADINSDASKEALRDIVAFMQD
ncbi:alpha/beta hydrolase fold domain-containing protein [Chitinophaga sp. Cy-1792]|uniref:alpha/beta hydrolase fold domain-containing protein n=1 Tax=Chitinophaga sp. Cy-1792 TaxID=2608339 RepID=UPI00141E2365|nr:alpha/beta hydrolase fold domain-containing protein [Chitinophaga sp. Cy-1792]NIG53976.1 alpha/beta hydrolase [Chitinophaga sp. Cy-1792]